MRFGERRQILRNLVRQSAEALSAANLISPMIARDLVPSSDEKRYRDCTDCNQSFKKPAENEYRCPRCRIAIAEGEHFDRIGRQLQDANLRIKS